MADSYDVTLEEAKKAKNKNFNKDAYKIYQRANSTGDMLHCPAYKHAFESVSKKLKEDKTLRALTAVDISRRCGAMLRNVKFDKNWEPVSKEDMEAHEWNMKYLTNLRWYRVGPDLSVDDLTAREERPGAFLQRDEEKKQQAADTLAQMLKEEFEKNFLKDDLLPSPEEMRQGMLEPLKNGKPMNCPFFENIFGDQKKMDELITTSEKCLSIKETVAILPGGVEFLEAHPEYDKFSNAFGVFTTLMLNSYAYKKYGLIFDASGAGVKSNFPVDAQTLEIYMKNYEDIYKEYRDVKKQ